MTRFLSKYEIPISIVSYTTFQDKNNNMLLVRELEEIEPNAPKTTKPQITQEQLCAMADSAGIGKSFRDILTLATELGLYPRIYKTSIMYTPPFMRNRMLFTAWAVKKKNGIKLYISPSEFAEFYPVSEEEATELLDLKNPGWITMTEEEVEKLLINLKKIFTIIKERSEDN